MNKRIEDLITDEQIECHYCFTNFGVIEHREHLRTSLLKLACNYGFGSGTEYLLLDLKVIERKAKGLRLTALGREYLYLAYNRTNNDN